MTNRKIEANITGSNVQGIAGAGTVVIENFTIYNHTVEEPVVTTAAVPRITPNSVAPSVRVGDCATFELAPGGPGCSRIARPGRPGSRLPGGDGPSSTVTRPYPRPSPSFPPPPRFPA